MRPTRFLATIFAALPALLGLTSPAFAQTREAAPPACVLQDGEASWIDGALASWARVRQQDLALEAGELPWIIFFDSACVWQINARGTTSPLTGTPHAGRISLPDGSSIDATVTSFSATYGAADRPFLVMALPSVWRNEPRHAANPGLERLMRSVFVHEATHTEQAHATGAWLKQLEKRSPLPADLTDDVIQQRFGSVPGFRQAYEAELDLLFRAASEADVVRRRSLAAEALDAMTSRRARYFAGADAVYADLDDLFLNMEGVANWAAYRTALNEIGNADEALAFIRRPKSWSQDEGLALFLVIDSLLPQWQARLFRDKPASIIDLLRAATTHPNG